MNETSPLNRRPAVRLALLLVGGILIAANLSITPSWYAVASGAFFGLAVLVLPTRWSASLSSLLLSLTVGTLGAYLYSTARTGTEKLLLAPREANETISIDGIVESKPNSDEKRIRFVLRADRIHRGTEDPVGWRRVIVSVRSDTANRSEPVRMGSAVHLTGTLEPFPSPRNPFEFDYGRYLSLNGIHGIVRVTDPSDLKVTGTSGTPTIQTMLNSLRSSITEVVEQFHDPEEASFLKGILLADRSGISPEVKQSFVDTGTIHVLAVSGLHVGIVALVFYAGLGLLRMRKSVVVIGTIGGLMLYMMITGSAPSVVRATIMATIILLGQLLERRTDIYNSLSVAAIVILLWDPRQLFNVGFQLSFAAVLSIVVLYPILEGWIKRIPERFEEVKAIDYVLKLFAVSLAAQIGTLPFTALYFERISMISLAANVVVVPIVGLNVMVGFATIVSSAFSSWVAACYGAVNNVLVAFLLGFVQAASSVPFASVETAHLSARFPIFYYVGVIGMFSLQKPRIRNRVIIVALLLLNLFLYVDLIGSSGPVLRVTMLDVGQGDALLVDFPNGRSLLIDAGPRSLNADAGETVIVPFLKRRGTTTLDAVLLSHAHSDHIGGIPTIMKNIHVGTLYESTAPSTSALYKEIELMAEDRGIRVCRIGLGDTIAVDPSTRIYALHPSLPSDHAVNLNNTSLVLKLMYGSTSILLTGDAETEPEKKLLERFGPFLSSTVLKAGHHGSITSSSENFLVRVGPQVAMISVGRNNKFRHPSPQVLNRMTSLHIRPVRTDQEGAIVLESDGQRIERVEWKK